MVFRRACYLRELSRFEEAIAGFRELMALSPLPLPYTESDFKFIIASTYEKWGKGEEQERMSQANLIYEQMYLERELRTDIG